MTTEPVHIDDMTPAQRRLIEAILRAKKVAAAKAEKDAQPRKDVAA